MSKYRWNKSFFFYFFLLYFLGGGDLGSIFAGYVPLSSKNPYPLYSILWPIIDPILVGKGEKKRNWERGWQTGLPFPTNYVKNIFGILSGGRYLAQTDIRWLPLSPSTTFQNAMPPQDANSPWDHFGYGFATPNRSVLNTILSLSSYKLKACFCFYSQWRVSWWCRWTNTSP